jgi:hypothetical protein
VVVPYPSAAVANAAFTNLQKNLDKYLKPATSTTTRLVFKDYENKFGVATVSGSTLALRLHLGKQP